MQPRKIGETKKMNGKMKIDENSFEHLFERQLQNQKNIINKGLYGSIEASVPEDNVFLASYHIQQLISEVGEVLEADKRWKNFRNNKYDKNNKLEEIADCFIVLMNIAMFSGFDSRQVFEAIMSKIQKVSERINEE